MSRHTDADRRLSFRRGFRDGAGNSAEAWTDRSDYMEGYAAGRQAYGSAAQAFRLKHGIKPPSLLRGG